MQLGYPIAPSNANVPPGAFWSPPGDPTGNPAAAFADQFQIGNPLAKPGTHPPANINMAAAPGRNKPDLFETMFGWIPPGYKFHEQLIPGVANWSLYLGSGIGGILIFRWLRKRSR